MFPRFFLKPQLSSQLGFLIPPFFIFSLKVKLRYRPWFTISIESDKGKIGRSGVPNLSRKRIFGLNPNPNLHRSPADHVYAGYKPQKIPDIHRAMKIQTIKRRRDRDAARMPERNYAGGIVDEFHDHAAVNIPGEVRILLHHLLNDDNTAFPHILWFGFAFHG
jgi:hypothetical protein